MKKIKIYNAGCVVLTDAIEEYSIDIEKHLLELIFREKAPDYQEEYNSFDAIELLVNEVPIYTFYRCHFSRISKDNYKLLFEIRLEGNFIENLDDKLCSAVEYTIDASPVPLSAISFLPTSSEFEKDNVVVKCEDCQEGVLITLQATEGMKFIGEFETIFFNILDITFLGYGYYPYIIKEVLLFGEGKREINRMQQSIYQKDFSISHWKKSIISGRDLNLSEAYSEYLEIIEKNKLVVPVLRNVVHAKEIYADLVLCNLLQCVEGYMKKMHTEEKYSSSVVKEIKKEVERTILSYILPENSGTTLEEIKNSVLGVMGMINQPSFGECLLMAINTDENTKSIFENEIRCNQFDVFIQKSKATRNQFSHMVPLKKSFEKGDELYRAMNKYSLLLRVLILNDIKVEVYNKDVKRLVDIINSTVV